MHTHTSEPVSLIKQVTIDASIMLESIKSIVKEMLESHDPAHDFQHVIRVYNNARLIGKKEEANMEILLPAVLLHDIVVYPKVSIQSSRSSEYSASLAEKILFNCGYSRTKITQISDCIHTHSYSNRIVPSSLEGKILQDADRLDALGAIGIARMFSVGGSEKRPFYNPLDPFYMHGRGLDDKKWTLDHLHTKLLKLKGLMHTSTAKRIARQRTKFMILFINQMEGEIFSYK